MIIKMGVINSYYKLNLNKKIEEKIIAFSGCEWSQCEYPQRDLFIYFFSIQKHHCYEFTCSVWKSI